MSRLLLPLLFVLSFSTQAATAPSVGPNSRVEREEPTIPERLAVLRNKNGAHPKDRSDNASALGQLTDARELRDQRVVEALCGIARDASDDLFVRMEAITALGTLQYHVFPDGFARGRYSMILIGIVKDAKEEELLRARAAKILGQTMPADEPLTKQAVVAMTACAADRQGSLLLRVACVDALATIGAAKEIFELVGTVLPQRNLDSLLQEHVIKALSEVLSRVETVEGLSVPDLIRLQRLFMDRSTPAEIRIRCMRALAILKRAKVARSLELEPEVRRILAQEENAQFVIEAIKVTGILDDTAFVPSLIKAYADFFDAQKVTRAADVQIRTQIIRTLGGMLSSQASRKRIDAEAIRKTAELFLKIIEPDEGNLETSEIREEAIFGLRYLYPKKAEFQRFHQAVAERLVLLLRAAEQQQAAPPQTVIDTLTIITRYPAGEDIQRWEKWYEKKYGQLQVVRTTTP